MSKKANPTVVGSFVLGAIALLVIALFVFGGGRMFEEKFSCVSYFDETISGLDVGAPVEFQGVRIGTVSNVKIVFREGAKITRPVTFQIEANRIDWQHERAAVKDETAQEAMEEMVKMGLRAQLASQSILTGKLKIELSLRTNTPVHRVNLADGMWEMPTIPSPLASISKKMEDLPLAEIVTDAHATIKGLAKIVTSPDVQDLVGNLNQTINRLDSLLAGVNTRLDPTINQVDSTLNAADQALAEITKLLTEVRTQVEPFLLSLTSTSDQLAGMLDNQSPMRYQIRRAMMEVGQAAESFRHLTDYLEQHPESLLRGKN